MSFMSVSYDLELQQEIGLPYRLYRYSSPEDEPEDPYSCKPVLFVPGNQGSYKQARSIGYWLATHGADKCMTTYTADLLEQWSVVSDRTLLNQASFIQDAITWIRSKHQTDKLIIVGHSMGSVVARLAIHQVDESGSISLVFLAAPMASPALDIDYRRLFAYTRDIVGQHVRVSGGHNDVQVLPVKEDPARNLIRSDKIPLVWSAPDHQAIVWVHQIIDHLGRLIYKLIL